MPLTPFDYQDRGIAGLRQCYASGKRRAILGMPMRSGKTLVAFELMRLAQEKGNRSLFLCDRRLLVDQAADRAREQGLDVGMIMARRGWDLSAACQFVMKQTVQKWIGSGKLELPEFQLGVIDECHRGLDYQKRLFDQYPGVFWVGLSGTPVLGNGDGMGAYYQEMIQPVMPSELKAAGRLVPVRAYAPHVPDLKGVRPGADGDYSGKSLSERMRRENMVSDVAGWWQKLGEGRPSIYYACDIAHAEAVVNEFRSAGVSAEIMCDETPDEERESIRQRFKFGSVDVVVNCDVLAEGIDWPWVSCIGLVRPTKRLRRYLQNACRGMGCDDGKRDCLLIDHSGTVLYHGCFPDADRVWPLSAADNIDRMNAARKPHEPGVLVCSNCKSLFSGGPVCPECGTRQNFKRRPADRARGNGTLVEVTAGELAPETTLKLMQRFWGTCIGVAIKRQKNAGMAATMFSKKFKVPPWEAGVDHLPADRDAWKRPARDVFPGFVRG